MKKLYKVTCGEKMAYSGCKTRDSIYVVAENESEAANKALNKMKELKYDLIDEFVSNVLLIADEKETNDVILIL